MARVGNTVNLEPGSKYDLLIFDYPEGYPIGRIDLKFAVTPKRISGVEKVAQVFLKTLLTYRSSDVVYSNRGTEYPSFTGSYNLQNANSQEVKSVITAAVTEAESQAKGILNVATESLTSQLESATVNNITPLDDGVNVQITLLTRAGETAPIALPFTSLGIQVNE